MLARAEGERERGKGAGERLAYKGAEGRLSGYASLDGSHETLRAGPIGLVIMIIKCLVVWIG